MEEHTEGCVGLGRLMSNVSICVRNILVFLGSCSVWLLIGVFFLSLDVKWPSIILFAFSGFCFLEALLNIAVLVKHGRGLNRLGKFPDILKG